MSPEVPIIILILSVPIYFLSKWILKKIRIVNNRNRRYLAIILTLFLSPLTYFEIIMIWLFSIWYYPEKDFAKQKWETNIKERHKMSEDIIESDILIGKTKQQIIELLGTDYSSNGEDNISCYLVFVSKVQFLHYACI